MKNSLAVVLLLTAAGTASAADDWYFWGSGGIETGLGAGGALGHAYYGTLMGGSNGGIFGISQTHMWVTKTDLLFDFPNDHSNIKETAALFGALFLKRHAYLALGIGRVQLDGSHCQAFEKKADCVTGGLSAALAVELPNRLMGVELRFAGNFNSVQSFGGFSAGVHFGSSLHDTWEATRRGSTAQAQGLPPVAQPAPPSTSALRTVSAPVTSPAPALGGPGQQAKLKDGAQARGRPTSNADVLTTIPAGATATLKASISNSDGAWWYVDANGHGGWVRATDLEFHAPATTTQ